MIIRPGRAFLGINTTGCTNCVSVAANLNGNTSGTNLEISVRQGAQTLLATVAGALALSTLLAF